MLTPEQIRHRKSVRTYNGEPLSRENCELLAEYAAALEDPYGIPVTFRVLDAEEYVLSSPVIVGAGTYLAGKLRQEPHAEEAFGYTFEKLLLYADSLGLGTVMIGGTMDRSAFERAMELSEDEVMPCVSPVGVPAQKPSFRETMMRKGVKADTRLDFASLFFDSGLRQPLDPMHPLAGALELVRLAPSAVNKQPWRVAVDGKRVHFYEKQSRGYVNASGWDMQKIDMGIALAHFEIGLEAAGLSASFDIDDPGLNTPDGERYIASYVLD